MRGMRGRRIFGIWGAVLVGWMSWTPVEGVALDEAWNWVVPEDVMERPELLDPVETNWRTLLGLDYRTGEVSPELEARRGQVVRIPGFMVPFEDGADGVDEFLLVPYFGACIHTPPPPPNQIVYVHMDRGQRVSVNIWDAIWIEGVLDIQSIESPYGTVGHQVIGMAIHPYGRED